MVCRNFPTNSAYILQIYEASLVTVSLSAPPPFPLLLLGPEALKNKTFAASSEGRNRKTESQPLVSHIFMDT